MRKSTRKRLAELERQLGDTTHHLAAAARIEALERDVDRLRERIKPKSFRTKQARFIGGTHDSATQWIDSPDPQIQRPHKYPLHSYYAWSEPTDDVYQLVGPSATSPDVYLYEFVSRVQRYPQVDAA